MGFDSAGTGNTNELSSFFKLGNVLGQRLCQKGFPNPWGPIQEKALPRLEAVLREQLTPFMFTLEPGNVHAIYHPPVQTEVEERLLADFRSRSGGRGGVGVFPASQMPANADITNPTQAAK